MASPTYDVAIVGAGPVGSYSAISLCSMGFSVAVLEEHPVVGRPVQCAGLVNSRIASLPHMGALKGSVLNDIFGADLFSPSGHKVELRAKRVKAQSIDRSAFDSALARHALDAGAHLMLGHKALSLQRESGSIRVPFSGIDGRGEIMAKAVVLCDGSDHRLRREAGLELPKELVPGISCEVQVQDPDLDPRNVAVFTGKAIAPGFFAWAIPAGTDGRIKLGLCASKGGDLRPRLLRFMSSEVLRSWTGPRGRRSRIGEISLTIGCVPIGPVEPHQKKGILLLGDAAGMAKPTSGGGIYPGLLAARTLASSIERCEEGICDAALSLFSRTWNRGYGRELRRSMVLRSIIDEVEDEEIDLAVTTLRDSEVLGYINEKGDIDRPFTLAAGVFAKDPSLATLIPRFIPRILMALGR